MTSIERLLQLAVFAGLSACKMESAEVQLDSSVSELDAGCSRPLSWCETRCPQTFELGQSDAQEDCIGPGSRLTSRVGKCSGYDYVFHSNGTGIYTYFYNEQTGQIVGGEFGSDTPNPTCEGTNFRVSVGLVPNCTQDSGVELCTPADSTTFPARRFDYSSIERKTRDTAATVISTSDSVVR